MILLIWHTNVIKIKTITLVSEAFDFFLGILMAIQTLLKS